MNYKMIKFILHGLFLTGTLTISETYGQINTPVTDKESPSKATQYLNNLVKLTKRFSSIPRDFLQNKLSQSLHLDKSTTVNDSVRNILKRLNPSPIISNTFGKINNIRDQYPLSDRKSPIRFKFNIGLKKSNTGFNGVIIYQSSGLCCVNGKCITLKSGEQCNYDTVFKSKNKNGKPQQTSFNKPFNSANDKTQRKSNRKAEP